MSWRVTQKVAELEGINSKEKSILMILAYAANEAGACNLSTSYLVRKSCLDFLTAIESVKRLEEQQLISVDRFSFAPRVDPPINGYQVNVPLIRSMVYTQNRANRAAS